VSGGEEKGPATLPSETSLAKYRSMTSGCCLAEGLFVVADLRLVWVIGQVASKLLRLEWAHNGHWVKQGGGWKGRENKRGKVEPFDMTQTKTAQRETVLRKNFNSKA